MDHLQNSQFSKDKQIHIFACFFVPNHGNEIKFFAMKGYFISPYVCIQFKPYS